MNTRPPDHSQFVTFLFNADTYLEILFPQSVVHRFTSYTSFLLICSDRYTLTQCITAWNLELKCRARRYGVYDKMLFEHELLTIHVQPQNFLWTLKDTLNKFPSRQVLTRRY